MAQTTNYFSRLNYTLANEDTAFELGILDDGVDHLFSVTGSGGRVLPLLAKKPKQVTCVDLANEQLYLAELRFQSVLVLDHAKFIQFWGYPSKNGKLSPKERKEIFHQFKLSDPARRFFEGLFTEINWDTILYLGRWESTICKLSQLNRSLTRKKGASLFDTKNQQEQIRYLQEEFPSFAWKTVLFLFGNASVFNMLLYKGSFPKKNIPSTMLKFYGDTFDHLFRHTLARENFFLQLIFFGEVMFPEGCPIECDPVVFSQAKEGLKSAEIFYRQGDIVEILKKTDKKVDFLSFSDVPSYFSGDRERNFMTEVRDSLSPGAKAVLRHYLHIPQGMRTDGYRDVTAQFAKLSEKEKVGVYQMEVLEKC